MKIIEKKSPRRRKKGEGGERKKEHDIFSLLSRSLLLKKGVHKHYFFLPFFRSLTLNKKIDDVNVNTCDIQYEVLNGESARGQRKTQKTLSPSAFVREVASEVNVGYFLFFLWFGGELKNVFFLLLRFLSKIFFSHRFKNKKLIFL